MSTTTSNINNNNDDDNNDRPDNANDECVGPTSEKAGTASSCEGCPNQSSCQSGAYKKDEAKDTATTALLQSNLANVSHIVLVLSGKGGVGKSTIACQLAHTLAHQNYAVGLLDIDLCGPSAPRMILGDAQYTHGGIRRTVDGKWIPIYNATTPNLGIVSIAFLLQDPDAAVIWRGPRKNALLQQFLTDVDWTGATDGIDYLIIDTPPGTSDEHISIVQYLQSLAPTTSTTSVHALVVTTGEEISCADVRKEINFCQKTNLPILGIIENMSSYQTTFQQLQFINTNTNKDCTNEILQLLQQKCPELLTDSIRVVADIFPSSSSVSLQRTSGGTNGVVVGGAGGGGGGGGVQLANDYNIEFWGHVPFDPQLLKACEDGIPYVTIPNTSNTVVTQILLSICTKLLEKLPVETVVDDDTEMNE